MGKVLLLHGRSEIKLGELGDNTVDSIVTDPPYGWSFMGKKWDYDVPGVEIWRECLRVLKPGGHLLCACGTRTQHRMAVNIEDAGFEIRDLIAWVYGSGFPKSLNVGKKIDQLQGNEREVLGTKDLKRGSSIADQTTETSVTGWNKPDYPSVVEITKGTSEFEGWGTALKPAMELWTLARKPISEKSIAENCLKWGTGGLNIDGCRVGVEERHSRENNISWGISRIGEDNNIRGNKATGITNLGRFPANLIHDGSDEVVGMFPEQKSGKRSSEYRIGNENGEMYNHGIYGKYASKNYDDVPASSGSAARFFYCAKASKADRDDGLEAMEDKVKLTQMRSANGTGDKNFEGGFTDSIRKNTHATVKPNTLMRYLCKLITPKGGTVLDPFMGSGSTGKAAVMEGFGFIGVEMEAEYVEIARARIAFAEGLVEEEVKKVDAQLKLF